MFLLPPAYRKGGNHSKGSALGVAGGNNGVPVLAFNY